MPAPTGMLRIQRPGHRAPQGFRSLPHPQRYTAAPGDFVGGGLRSWLALRYPCTSAHRPPGTHSLRSRHSSAAASAPAALPALTVPQWVRLGQAPCRERRIDPLDARPLPERPPGRRPHSDLPSCGLLRSGVAPCCAGAGIGCVDASGKTGGDPRRYGGVVGAKGTPGDAGGSAKRPVERGMGIAAKRRPVREWNRQRAGERSRA